MQQIGLYYPYMTPSTSWLKQSLLMFENVTSIVSPTVQRRNADLEWLAAEGIWSPSLVDIGYAEGYRDEIETTLLEFADRDDYRIVAPTLRTRIYAGKLNRQIEQSMVDLGLAKVELRTGNLLAHREVAALVLTITAKHLAMAYRNIDSRLVPSTDLPIYEKIAYDPLRRSPDRYRCLELLLDDLLPSPGPDISIPDVISFRRHHRDELGAFWVEIDRMLRVVRSSDDPLEEVRSMRGDIEQSIARLKRAAKSRRFRLAAGSCAVLVLGVTASTAIHDETFHWVFDGFGAAGIATLVDRLVRGRPGPDALAYLVSAQNAFG